MNSTCRLAVIFALFGLASCAPQAGSYADRYGGTYLAGGETMIRTGIHQVGGHDRRAVRRVGQSAAERDAYLRGVAAARRQALRDIEVQRQLDRARRAERSRDWAERDVRQAERERRRAEWRDRRPVRTDRHDGRDFERREALFEEHRARVGHDRARRMADRERSRLDRMERADRVQDRIDRIDRMQRRGRAQ